MNDPVDTTERCAFDAWPAEEVECQAGWRLRATRGVTRRANSVWTLEATGHASVEERVDRAEAWYGSRHLAPTFQIAERALPEGLDAALEHRGYVIDAPVSIQVAATKDVLASTRASDAVVTRTCSEEWFDLSARRGRFAQVADTYRGVLDWIGSAGRFALARVDGLPVAVGLGVVGRGWMGIFSMLTLPRRGGLGRRGRFWSASPRPRRKKESRPSISRSSGATPPRSRSMPRRRSVSSTGITTGSPRSTGARRERLP